MLRLAANQANGSLPSGRNVAAGLSGLVKSTDEMTVHITVCTVISYQFVFVLPEL